MHNTGNEYLTPFFFLGQALNDYTWYMCSNKYSLWISRYRAGERHKLDGYDWCMNKDEVSGYTCYVITGGKWLRLGFCLSEIVDHLVTSDDFKLTDETPLHPNLWITCNDGSILHILEAKERIAA